MNVDVLAVVDTGDVGSVDQTGDGVTLTFMSGSRALRICFVKPDMFLAFADQVGHVAHDVEVMKRDRVVDSLVGRKGGFVSRHCKGCNTNIDVPVAAMFCHRCGEELESLMERKGE